MRDMDLKASNPGMTASQLLDIMNARRLNFYDEFNRTAEDTDVWTSGGDAGTFTHNPADGTYWRLTTGNVINNDRFIQGDGVINNKAFVPWEDGYTTLTWEARLSLASIADISAMWGLWQTMQDDYIEAASRCLHFLADPAITNTFRVRTWEVAEEETDTLVALDTDFHKFKIVYTAASVLFYIDDVLVATHVTRVPIVTVMQEFLIRTKAAATKNMTIDYVRVELS